MIGSWVAAVAVGWRDRPGEALVRLALVLVALTVPLAVSTSWYNSFGAVKCAVLGVIVTLAAGGWLADSLARGRIRLPWSAGVGLLTLWWAWLLTGFLRSPEPVLVLRAVAFHTAQVLLVVLAAVALRTASARRAVVSGALVAGMLVAVLGLLQYSELDVVVLPHLRVRGLIDLGSFIYLPREEEGFKIYSLLGHRNYVASFVAGLLPVVVGRACLVREGGGPSPWARAGYEALGLLFVAVGLLTQTRGAWIAGAAGLALLLALGFGPWRKRMSRRRVAGFLVLASGVGVAVGWPSVPPAALAGLALAAVAATMLARRPMPPRGAVALSMAALVGLSAWGWFRLAPPPAAGRGRPSGGRQSVTERLGDLFRPSAGSVLERRLILKTAWRVVTRDPTTFLTGVGSGSYAMAHITEQARILGAPEGAAFRPVACKATYVHSEPLQVWAETGLVGLVLTVAWLGWFIASVALPLGGRPPVGGDGEALGLICGLAAILVHNLVSFTLLLPTVGSYAALALGLLVAESGLELRTLHLGRVPWVVRGCAVVGVGLAMLATLATLASVRSGELARMASRRAVAAHRADRAIILSLTAAFGGLRDPDAVVNAGSVALGAGLNETARRLFARARPGGTDWWLETSVGLGFEREGLEREAERSYRSALALNPVHRPALVRLALICLRTGRFDEAGALVETGLAVGQPDPALLLYRGVLAFRRGELTRAREALEGSLALDPTQATARLYLGILTADPSPETLQAALDAMDGTSAEDFHLRVLRDHLAWRRSRGAP